MFKNLKISTKPGSGFGCLLVLMAILTLSGVNMKEEKGGREAPLPVKAVPALLNKPLIVQKGGNGTRKRGVTLNPGNGQDVPDDEFERS